MIQPAVRHFVGLDLGQPHEFTALAVLERPLVSAEDVLLADHWQAVRQAQIVSPAPATESTTLSAESAS